MDPSNNHVCFWLFHRSFLGRISCFLWARILNKFISILSFFICMWRKYRKSVLNKKLKRIRGRKRSLIYQKQILSVQNIFSYLKSNHQFYHFYIKGSLPYTLKNKKRTQFLGIELSRGSSLLLVKIIREIHITKH